MGGELGRQGSRIEKIVERRRGRSGRGRGGG